MSTHFVNPSITKFKESESEKVAINPCSTKVTMKEPAFRANSTRPYSTASVFFKSIVLVFYMRDVSQVAPELTLTTSAIFSTSPTRLWRPGTGARPTICWICLREIIIPWSTVCVLLGPAWGASAGDGGGGKHSMGDDVSGPVVAPCSVSTCVNLDRDVGFELTYAVGRWQGVRGCLALADGLGRPIENLWRSSATSMEKYD